jgi:hypothetical protein
MSIETAFCLENNNLYEHGRISVLKLFRSTTIVLAPWRKIQTFTGKQDSSIQIFPKTDLDIWNSAFGMY